MKHKLYRFFLKLSGYTYSNLARLFMRLFVGIMFMQFGIRQIVDFETMSATFPSMLGMTSQTCLLLMILVELLCSTLIILGLLTRLSTIPPIISMILAEYYIVHDMLGGLDPAVLDSTDPGYVPIMFIGIYIFLLIAGPGKISLDYLISLKLVADMDSSEEKELEEV